MGLEQIYAQIVAENSRSTEHKHEIEGHTHELEGVNPSCGDDITLQLKVKDGVIKDAAFLGSGCAISQASASMMIDLILGKTVEEAKGLANIFIGMIKGEVTDESKLEMLEDAQALRDISHMPARVKCAVLGWHTLENALEGTEEAVTTE